MKPQVRCGRLCIRQHGAAVADIAHERRMLWQTDTAEGMARMCARVSAACVAAAGTGSRACGHHHLHGGRQRA